MNDFHIVRKGDTLSAIARKYGSTVPELGKINALSDPNRLRIGQRIAIRKEAVLGFEALFLDADRNPIKNLDYLLEFNGKQIGGSTGVNGKTLKIMTETATDQIRILVKRFDGTLKEIGRVASGYGNKLCTLISPLVVVEGELKPHLKKPQEDMRAKEAINPAYAKNKPPTATVGKKDLGPQLVRTELRDGKPFVVVEGDIPDLSRFLDSYTGEPILQTDIEDAARILRCDPGLIYAIAKQESGKSSFFRLGDRTVPTVLFERHIFRRLTRPKQAASSPYEAAYPDICGPQYIRAAQDKSGNWISKETKKGEPQKIIAETDTYAYRNAYQYKRLWKAYQLDSSAALQACSWGKFQIMGFNYQAAGFQSVALFVRAMSRSDAEHIKAFLKFAKANPRLSEGLRSKNFEKIAAGHNGTDWRNLNPEYASNIEKFYKEYLSRN